MGLPSHLAQIQAQGLVAGQPVAQFELGSMRNFVYLMIDWTTRQAALIDCQSDLQPILLALRQNSLQLSQVWLTHTHHDHVAGLEALVLQYPQLLIHVHAMDVQRLPRSLHDTGCLVLIQDQQMLDLGKAKIQVMHTPGHSRGECCFFVGESQPPFLFTGDTLFIRDCGRTDFEGGSDAQMFESLQRIKRLPPATVILPGHHYRQECASTLEKEMLESPPLLCGTVDELIATA